jgi:hypothetical protein
MKQLRLVFGLALAAALISASPASAQTTPSSPQSGSFTMSMHTHSDAELRFGSIQQLPYDAVPGSTFLYSSRRCENFAPYNDVGLVMGPDVRGLQSPLRVRHRVQGVVKTGNSEAGTIEGDAVSVRCLAPSPTGPDAQGTGGPETGDVFRTDLIRMSFRVTYARDSQNALRFSGTFTITGGEGAFAGLGGSGTFEGGFVCLGALRPGAPQPSCAQRGQYSDFVTLRGDLAAPFGQHDPGVRGTYSLSSAPAARPQLKVSTQRRFATDGRICVNFRVTADGKAVKGALVRFAQQKRSTGLNGRVRICGRLAPGTQRALATRAGYKTARLAVLIPRR